LLAAPSPPLEGPQEDFAIAAWLGEEAGVKGLTGTSAAAVLSRMAAQEPAFAGLSYQKLAEVTEQWPIVGRGDMYYGGTTYENKQGLGVQLPLAGGAGELTWPQVPEFKLPRPGLMAFPITRLYDQGSTLLPAQLLRHRIGEPYVLLNVEDAGRLRVRQGDLVRLVFASGMGTGEPAAGSSTVVQARLDEGLPERVVLVPRSFGIPISGPAMVEIRLA
jgi:NADH-quinone oxidoreductase subunit G